MKFLSLLLVISLSLSLIAVGADDGNTRAKLDADYAEMRKLYPVAAEVLKEHPTHQMWAKKKAALLAANYLKTEDLKVVRKFADGKQARAFYFDTLKAFRGLEIHWRTLPEGAGYQLTVWANDADMKVLRALAAAE